MQSPVCNEEGFGGGDGSDLEKYGPQIQLEKFDSANSKKAR